MPCITEGEARVYWNAVQRFRLMRRKGEACPETADDVGLMSTMSENPTIRRDCARLLQATETAAAGA